MAKTAKMDKMKKLDKMDKTLKIVENSKKNDFAYLTIFWWDQEFGESDQAQCQIKWKYTKF